MDFFVYRTTRPELTDMMDEPIGCENKHIWHDLKTVRGAVNRARGWFTKGETFKVYAFTNFYDSKTFRLVYVGK